MPFAPLPGIRLSWDVTELSVVEFLRYELQRQPLGSDVGFAPVAAITDPSRAVYEDFTPEPAVVYEYRIRQVQLIDGNEIPSEWSSSIQASVRFTSTFLHAHGRPALYLQILPERMQRHIPSGGEGIQGWDEEASTFYYDEGAGETLAFEVTGWWLDTYRSVLGIDFHRQLVELMKWQRDTGGVFYVRQYKDVAMYCAIGDAEISYDRVDYTVPIRLQQAVRPEEGV